MSASVVTFWTGLGLLAWIYAGYPVFLAGLRALRVRRPVHVAPVEPRVTVIISAYNERQVIGAKLENCRALDYPPDRLEVIVVSDASDDGTDEIVAASGPPVRLLRMESRGGKTVGLNAALRVATGEIIVFSDANAMYQRDALRMLVRNFADPRVGAVTGESRYEIGADDSSTESEDTYWSYEIWIKTLESSLGSVVGGDGAIYAIRRSLYRDLAPGDLSDFVNPLQIVDQGYRNVYEPAAVSWEGGAEGYGAEFRRKVRIVNRAWRATFKMRALLNPFRHGFFAFQFLSHKVLRWLAPWLLALIFAANLLCVGEAPVYRLLLAGQVLCYGLAALGWLLAGRGGVVGRVATIPYYFCLVNLASLVALVEVLGGKEYRTWASSRPEAASGSAVAP
jgi:cellulose synthase/poly-beta-1,6-N-acetylglucosamine synthase-like glycosyltransferase